MEIMPENELLMVVEDDPLNLKTIARILADAGYRVHPAQNGRQCLDEVRTVRPHLILMDINMPTLDGIETCRRIKNDPTTRDLPVVFVTGSFDDHFLAAAIDAGGCDFVHKPVSRMELLFRVRSALFKKRSAHRLADERELEAALERAGVVCHELNQPLQYILGAVQLLMLDVPEEKPMFRSLDTIRARVEQMGEITRRLSEITHDRTRNGARDPQIGGLLRMSDQPPSAPEDPTP